MKKDLLRLCTSGSVDDGKSTLVGRLLFEVGALAEDHIEAARKATTGEFPEGIDFSLITDGLLAEREQKITIDVAYRYFETERRRFILADSPGHIQYTKNQAAAASVSETGILVVDITSGFSEQSRRHLMVMILLGVKHILIAINKMDLVSFALAPFESLKSEIGEFAGRLRVSDLRFIPISAKFGDNVTRRSERTSWYQGETVMSLLQSLFVRGDENQIDVRLPVQRVIVEGDGRPRGICGTLASGRIHRGQEIMVASSGLKSRITRIQTPRVDDAKVAFAGEAVVVWMEDHIDTGRGELLAPPLNQPTLSADVEAMVVWFSGNSLRVGSSYALKHTHKWVHGLVDEIRYKIDLADTSRLEARELRDNDIGRVRLKLSEPLACDPYEGNRHTGSFLLVDEDSSHTVGLGLILKSHSRSQALQTEESRKGRVFWLTGRPGAGKTSIGNRLAEELKVRGRHAVMLDGDQIRQGLNADLGFSQKDRLENVRRVAEVAKLFAQEGSDVIVALISPMNEQRAAARRIVGGGFFEVFIDCPLDVCIQRDPKGLYRKAKEGSLTEFTGVSSEYEEPEAPDFRLKTDSRAVEDCVAEILSSPKI
ncbi:MAG: adenylyl-sulfate kinase [Bdellovibrionaceae bacterium]|nr:adenylyl-sulfate kinase [Pseudobdellovibrionaceae bacterium]